MTKPVAEMSFTEAEAAFNETCRNLSLTQIEQIQKNNQEMIRQFPKMQHARALYDRQEALQASASEVGVEYGNNGSLYHHPV